MKQDFVPGPWIARGVAVYTDHGGRSRPLKVCDARQPKFTVEAQEGSARLIAAAPDLLYALEAVIDDLVNGMQDCIDNGASEAWLAGAEVRLKNARAAIAKAMGEVA